ncbi:MAG: hypothetical protein FWC11_06550 [Firmicutes bacterium]|nr:hypothetical protein [Bacillota bacterium]MCL2256488.1 hypothetical protein [Bacillota bacterium]
MTTDFHDDLKKLIGEIDETKSLLKLEKETKAKQSTKETMLQKTIKNEKKHYHEGRRERVRSSVDADPDFESFSEHEVLEYLLYPVVKRVDTNAIAHDLISRFGTFFGVLHATIDELVEVPYITVEVARYLTSIIPAARKAEISKLKNNVFIDSTLLAVEYLRPFFQNRNNERMIVCTLDNNDRVLSVDTISEGDTAYTTVDIKKIVQTACRHSAVKVIIAHNHPAGTLQPSDADKSSTSKIGIALSAMGILLVDHLIFTTNGHYSFFSEGLFDSIYEATDRTLGTQMARELRQRKTRTKEGKYVFEKGSDFMELFETETKDEDK